MHTPLFDLPRPIRLPAPDPWLLPPSHRVPLTAADATGSALSSPAASFVPSVSFCLIPLPSALPAHSRSVPIRASADYPCPAPAPAPGLRLPFLSPAHQRFSNPSDCSNSPINFAAKISPNPFPKNNFHRPTSLNENLLPKTNHPPLRACSPPSFPSLPPVQFPLPFRCPLRSSPFPNRLNYPPLLTPVP